MLLHTFLRKKIGLVSLLMLVVSCKTHYNLVDIQPQQNTKVEAEIQEKKQYVETIAPYKQKMATTMSEKLSYTPVELTKRWDINNNLGDILADFTLDGAQLWGQHKNIKVEAAVLNVGGIRNSIPAGDITVKNVFEVMPFENELVIVKLKGKDMQGLFDYYAKTRKFNPVAGLYIEVEDGVLKKALVQGKEVDPNQDYYIATSDYLALGGDYMSFFSKGELLYTELKLRDLFIEYFKKNPEIEEPKDIRLIFTSKKQ